jgi:hypothetical protein
METGTRNFMYQQDAGSVMSAGTIWNFEQCRKAITSLRGQLGFPDGPDLAVLRLHLDLSTGALGTEPDGTPVPGIRPRVFCILDSYSRAKEVPETFRLISFDKVPGGTAYAATFRQRAVRPLADMFGLDRKRFARVLEEFGAVPTAYADHSWKLPALPRVPVYLLLWEGADEFPPSANLLFDGSVSAYLETEAIAILGELVTERIAFFMDDARFIPSYRDPVQ